MPNNVQVTVTVSPDVRSGLQRVARDRGLTVTALIEHLAAGRLELIPPQTLELYQRLAMGNDGEELRRIARAVEVLANSSQVAVHRLYAQDAPTTGTDAGDGPGSSAGS